MGITPISFPTLPSFARFAVHEFFGRLRRAGTQGLMVSIEEKTKCWSQNQSS